MSCSIDCVAHITRELHSPKALALFVYMYKTLNSYQWVWKLELRFWENILLTQIYNILDICVFYIVKPITVLWNSLISYRQ